MNEKSSNPPAKIQVLLVDDDRALLETTAALLSFDFEVHTASNGIDALQLLSTLKIDVLCTDYRMPQMDGLVLLQRAAAQNEDLIGILITGFRDQLPEGVRADPAVFSVVYKPYEPENLTSMVQHAMKTASMNASMSKFAQNSMRLSANRR